jgi:hypothetical protein
MEPCSGRAQASIKMSRSLERSVVAALQRVLQRPAAYGITGTPTGAGPLGTPRIGGTIGVTIGNAGNMSGPIPRILWPSGAYTPTVPS